MRFETIGNTTVICYENDQPILATDPWIVGSAYFGRGSGSATTASRLSSSWQSHEVFSASNK